MCNCTTKEFLGRSAFEGQQQKRTPINDKVDSDTEVRKTCEAMIEETPFAVATEKLVASILSNYGTSMCATYQNAKGCDKECPNYDRDYACVNEQDKHGRNRRVECAVRFFASKTMLIKHHNHGLMLNGKYVYSPKSGRWRRVRGGPWYYSKSPEDFYDRFVD
jgi:hypothetical protein